MTATKKVTENVVKKEAVKKEVEVDEPTKGDYGIQSVIKFVNGTFKTEFFTDKTDKGHPITDYCSQQNH